jgi:16S rRNA (guanine1207-N2)-methyltransferase
MTDPERDEALLGAPDVVTETPTLELGGDRAVRRVGGVAILPWRGAWLAARAAGLVAHAETAALGDARFEQCVVHLQKSRDATAHALADAWRHLAPGGRLLFYGGNELGVASAVKRLASELRQPGRVLANRRHARVVLFERAEGPAPARPAPLHIEAALAGDAPHRLEVSAGAFSARRLDPGSERLIAALARIERPPQRILDVGAGIGALGLAALLRFPEATAVLLDADARAVAAASHNVRALGLEQRCTVVWWDASERVPGDDSELVLLNPPFHAGANVDLSPARAMFARVGEALARGGTALVVANRTLPYERDLAEVGRVEKIEESRFYKLLSLRRHSRSASARRRSAPGARSSGSV